MTSVTDAGRVRRLEDKTAVIFGAAGEVGSAVAKGSPLGDFARLRGRG
jgi:hypothetical protein